MSKKLNRLIDKNININNNTFAGIIALTAGIYAIGHHLKSVFDNILLVLALLILLTLLFSYFVRLNLIDNLISKIKEDD